MGPWLRKVMISILLIFPVIFVSLAYLEDFAETNGQNGTEGVISLLINVPKNAIALASEAGYAGIFILMLLEAAALPIPSEIILPFAGYLVYRGNLEFWSVVALTTVAALVGSFVDYYLGLKLGYLLTNGSRIPFVSDRGLRRAENWFKHYGPVAVVLLRLVPGARVLISFPAGIYGMNRMKFGLYTLVGCLPWNITLVYLGWWLGSSWGSVVEAFRFINLIAYTLLVLLVVWAARRIISRRKS